MTTTDLHRCPSCGIPHRTPKAYRVLVAVMLAALLAAVQVYAALLLDGWIAIVLWATAARNVLVIVTLVYGLATAATEGYGEAAR